MFLNIDAFAPYIHLFKIMEMRLKWQEENIYANYEILRVSF